MNRRQILAGAGAITGAAALGVVAQAAPSPVKTISAEEHRRLRPAMYENDDRIVVERIAGSPERKIFYVHTGDLPRERCRELLREVAQEIACRAIG